MTTDAIQQAQRHYLSEILAGPLGDLSGACAAVWNDTASVDQLLAEHLARLPHCRLLYGLDAAGVQWSANILPDGTQGGFRGQDLSRRPFWPGDSAGAGVTLSPVYLDQHERIPCITAIHAVRQGPDTLGYLAADFALHDLHLPAPQERTGGEWAQYRGDPAIRETLFLQHRASTSLEKQMDPVLEIVETLFRERGIFHAKVHFSGSRVTLWPTMDPFRYRVHTLEEILDPDLFLSYPAPAEAPCPRPNPETVSSALDRFKILRRMDETLYLRSGSLNVCNGLVGLNFSCDGTHYMGLDDFLGKGLEFWLGSKAERC